MVTDDRKILQPDHPGLNKSQTVDLTGHSRITIISLFAQADDMCNQMVHDATILL